MMSVLQSEFEIRAYVASRLQKSANEDEEDNEEPSQQRKSTSGITIPDWIVTWLHDERLYGDSMQKQQIYVTK